MSEWISRQAVLDDAHRQLWYRMNQQGMKDRIDEWLKSLPSAEPEQKKGKWIKQYDEEDYPLGCKCSECEKTYVMPEGWANFFPNCGADMRGGEE